MKHFASLSLAALFVVGLGVSAQAVPFEDYFGLEATEASQPTPTYAAGHPYTRCHGRASGTSDVSCGTLTGGPSGGLF